ncbi:hypothetical protein BD779DRAFT_1540444, partial [Infundibulicybe gibba]
WSGAQAETHTVHFPQLIQGPNVLSTGADFTSNGPLRSCGFNGDGCTIVETTLRNPPSPGAGSSTDISLIPDHKFSVTTGFGYFNGCDGLGANCNNPQCTTAFFQPGDNQVQVQCEANNVNLAITFC